MPRLNSSPWRCARRASRSVGVSPAMSKVVPKTCASPWCRVVIVNNIHRRLSRSNLHSGKYDLHLTPSLHIVCDIHPFRNPPHPTQNWLPWKLPPPRSAGAGRRKAPMEGAAEGISSIDAFLRPVPGGLGGSTPRDANFGWGGGISVPRTTTVNCLLSTLSRCSGIAQAETHVCRGHPTLLRNAKSIETLGEQR